ncbi:MAG TPA: 4Fe-4S binding protein [Erysipelothrix sp.]|jgi:[FeFe] hydrogenase (group B1/B3)|nr:4Fe-4S binding protein [Erysipelothrix sp.]
MRIRYIDSPIRYLRNEVFKAVASAAYDEWSSEQINHIPFVIIEGDFPTYRESVTRERKIVSERVRLALGLDLWDIDELNGFSRDFDLDYLKEHKLPNQALRVIPSACESCEEKSYFVSNTCHGCLAHPCIQVCPVHATSLQNGLSFIDQSACIKCGKCFDVCPYGSIIKNERPCVAACGANAFTKNPENDKAIIISNKCVACGMCMVSCPFGAIMDKSEIYQVVNATKEEEVYAIVAPAIVGQFGDKVSYPQIVAGLKQLGFTDVKEVALGADITTVVESEEYVHHVLQGDQPFLATSCCPAWSKFAKRELKELKYCVSESSSPMIETAKLIRQDDSNAVIVFIGPCSAKKQEVAEPKLAGWVDYVLTFEEVDSMLQARDIDLSSFEVDDLEDDASSDGRGFAVSGGVLAAIDNIMKEKYPDLVFNTDRAENLAECRKLLLQAKFGKRNKFIIEGMACPGGCVGGAGTIQNQNKTARHVKQFAASSSMKSSSEVYDKIVK